MYFYFTFISCNNYDLQPHSAARTVGVFWMNAAETWVDISSSSARKVDFAV